jgi:hypothetical protein
MPRAFAVLRLTELELARLPDGEIAGPGTLASRAALLWFGDIIEDTGTDLSAYASIIPPVRRTRSIRN